LIAAMTAVMLRPATSADLDAVNAVIERAIMTWNLPERVKRLTLSSYRYNAHDLEHLHMVVAEDAGHAVLGVSAWEPASARDLPVGKTGLLLHGLYVDPDHQRQGVGSLLLAAAVRAASEQGFDGLLVKAQHAAENFFLARGLEALTVTDAERDYPHRFWKAAPRNA
jgi:GNAT superfamily N-acetyltransferase